MKTEQEMKPKTGKVNHLDLYVFSPVPTHLGDKAEAMVTALDDDNKLLPGATVHLSVSFGGNLPTLEIGTAVTDECGRAVIKGKIPYNRKVAYAIKRSYFGLPMEIFAWAEREDNKE